MPSRASLERTLCRGRAGCVLHTMVRAGTNDSGEPLHVARLDPPEILRHGGVWTRRSDRRRASVFAWDFALFAGTIADDVPLCENDPDAHRVCQTIGSTLEDNGPVCSVTSASFPRVRVADAYMSDGWRRASHGRCAVHATTARDGAPAASSDTALSAVLTRDATYVNITDDVWSTQANETDTGDLLHLYVELTTPEPRVCFSGERHVREITIRIPSGEVLEGGPVAVAVERRGRTAHIAITASTMDWDTIVLAYDDRDDDTAIARTLTTSTRGIGGRLVPQRIYELDGDIASCAVEDGALEVVFRERAAHEALIPADWVWQ